MRPGEPAERECHIGAGEHRRIQPLGAADQEADRAAGGEPAFEQCGQLLAVGRGAGGVEGDDERARRQGGEQRLALAAAALGGGAARLGDLGERQLGRRRSA